MCMVTIIIGIVAVAMPYLLTILHNFPGSNPFVPTSRTASSRKSVPIPGVSGRIQRERGTKVHVSAI